MKNLKKLLTILLVGVLLAALCVPSWAAGDVKLYADRKTEKVLVKDDPRFQKLSFTLNDGKGGKITLSFDKAFLEEVAIPLSFDFPYGSMWDDLDPASSRGYGAIPVNLYTINIQYGASLTGDTLYVPFMPLAYYDNCWHSTDDIFSYSISNNRMVFSGEQPKSNILYDIGEDRWGQEIMFRFVKDSDTIDKLAPFDPIYGYDRTEPTAAGKISAFHEVSLSFRSQMEDGSTKIISIDFDKAIVQIVKIPMNHYGYWRDPLPDALYTDEEIVLFTINYSAPVHFASDDGSQYVLQCIGYSYSDAYGWEHAGYGELFTSTENQLAYMGRDGATPFSAENAKHLSKDIFNTGITNTDENGTKRAIFFRFVTDDTIIEYPVAEEAPASTDTPAPETPAAPAAPAAPVEEPVEEPVAEQPAEDPEANLIDPAVPQRDNYTLIDPVAPELDPFTLLDPVGALLEPFTVLNP